MAAQEQMNAISDSPSGQSGLPQPTRSDTGSSASSGGNPPTHLSPGTYVFHIHGNCPRCHHYHKAARISIRISADASQVSHAYCENCERKWLAFGGTNATRISLISTQTMEPDVAEQRFREAVFEMVRSPSALASVPEKPSRGPSREHSTHSRQDDRAQVGPSEGTRQAQTQTPRTRRGASGATTEGTGPAADKVHASGSSRQRQGILGHIKGKMRNQLLEFKNFHLRPLVRRKRQSKLTAKGLGKKPIPHAESPDEKTKSASATDAPGGNDGGAVAVPTASPHATRDAPTAAWVPPTGTVDRELVKGMTMEKRVEWMRAQFTEFKTRFPHHRHHGLLRPSIANSQTGNLDVQLPPPPPSPQSPPRRPSEHRYSDDLLLIGSHLHSFHAGELFDSSRPLSIGSATRLSQAVTAVNTDGFTVTTAAPTSEMNLQQRHSLRSLRPHSFSTAPSRFRLSRGVEDGNSRPSMDSSTTGGAVRSLSSMGMQADERSISSLPLNSLLSDAPSEAANLASAPALNGRLSPEELLRRGGS